MVGLTYLQSVIKHSGDEGLDEEGEKNYSQIFSAFSFYPLPLNGSLWQARTFLFLPTFFFFSFLFLMLVLTTLVSYLVLPGFF